METDEPLESGYGAGAPRGDNLLNDFVQGNADSYAALALERGDRVVEDEDFGLMLSDGGSPSSFGNVAVTRRPLSDAEWVEASARMHAFYAEQPGGDFMTFSGWSTPDLRAHDFGAIGHPPLMFRAPAPLESPAPDGFTVVAVDDDKTAGAFEFVLITGFPAPELDPGTRGRMIGLEQPAASGWRHYLGLVDGRPAATASAYVDEHHVHVDLVSTLPEFRGRGIGYAITAAATQAEMDRVAMLVASDLGRSVYRRMGYLTLSRFTLWSGHRRY